MVGFVNFIYLTLLIFFFGRWESLFIGFLINIISIIIIFLNIVYTVVGEEAIREEANISLEYSVPKTRATKGLVVLVVSSLLVGSPGYLDI